jgi:hypothetical protein
LFAVESKQGKLFYPAKAMPVKTAEQLAAAAGGAVQPGAQPAAGQQTAPAGAEVEKK